MIELRHTSGQNGPSTRQAYDTFYQTQAFAIRDSFFLWLLELMDLQPGEIFLDVACGRGRLVQLAVQQGHQAIGIDFAKDGVYAGSQVTTAAHWLAGDGECLPVADHTIDAIASIGSLEHYQNPLQGVREIVRVLKPNGRACILLPNAFGLLGNIRRVYQTGEVFDDDQPLQRYATPATWAAMLAQGGLMVEHLLAWGEANWPRTAEDWAWTVRRPQKILRLLIGQWIPPNLDNQLIFLCRPAAVMPAPTAHLTLPQSWL